MQIPRVSLSLSNFLSQLSLQIPRFYFFDLRPSPFLIIIFLRRQSISFRFLYTTTSIILLFFLCSFLFFIRKAVRRQPAIITFLVMFFLVRSIIMPFCFGSYDVISMIKMLFLLCGKPY